MKFAKLVLIVALIFGGWQIAMFAQDPPNVQPSDVVVDQPAAPTTEVPSPAQPAHYEENFMWALIGSLVFQGLKKAPWFTLISDETSRRAKVAWGWALAIITAAGINFSIQGNFFSADGATISFAGISASVIKDVVWTWGSQQVWYKGLIKEPSAILLNSVTRALSGR